MDITIAYIVAISSSFLIFLLTTYLVIKKWIGFSFALLFLIFGLTSGLVIANHDLFRSFLLDSLSDHPEDLDLKVANFHEHVLKSHDDLKAEIEIQKNKLLTIHDEVQKIKRNTQKQ
jgi:hypothetical protein